METKKRNYGIDFLRIIAMFMISAIHVLGKGGALNISTDTPFTYWTGYTIYAAVFCCVDCYALISGYVAVDSKHKMSGIINLWMLVSFYSIVITVVYKFIFPDSVGLKMLVSAFLPLTSNQYWYFTAYFALFMFIPLINKGINALSEKELRNLCIILITVFSFMSTVSLVLNSVSSDTLSLNSGYSPWWLMILYIIGGYLKKFGNKISPKHTKFKWLCVYALSILLTLLYKLLIIKFNDFIGRDGDGNLMFEYTSPTILLAGISLLMIFSNLKINNIWEKIIGFLSPMAFSVYLIHVHPCVFQLTLDDAFSKFTDLSAPIYALAVICASLSIYIVCTLIDIPRFYLFKLIKIKKFSSFIERKISAFSDKFIRKFFPSLSGCSNNCNPPTPDK